MIFKDDTRHKMKRVVYFKRRVIFSDFSKNRLSSTHFILLIISNIFLIGCGGAKPDYAAQACQQGQVLLKKRIGPEFGKLFKAQAIPIVKPKLYGCAFIFTRIDEEMPGEVLGQYGASSTSQELVFVLPDIQGRLILQTSSPPLYRKTVVKLSFNSKEVYGGGEPELIVSEKATQASSRYRALRIFSFAEGVPVPKEIFSEQLLIKIPEGIEIIPQWSFEKFEEQDAIVMRGGGEFQVFMWSDGTQRYKIDLAASQRRKLAKSKARPPSTSSTPSTLLPRKPPPSPKPKTAPTSDEKDKNTSVSDLLKSL